MKHISLGHKRVSVTFLLLSVTFCVCLVCSNLFVPRLWSLGVGSLQLSGAVVIFPISYIINDLLTEVYGFRATRLVIWTGFVMCLLISLASLLVTMLPAPVYEDSREMAEKFDCIYAFVPRVMAGSLLAFVFGSILNSLVMSKMKIASEGRNFWFRAVVSSFAGEAVDSLIFVPIAFAGTLPICGMLGLIATQVTAKTIYEILILPLTSLIVRKLKSYESIDTFDKGISYNPFSISDIQ